jgi:hypothetical protein
MQIKFACLTLVMSLVTMSTVAAETKPMPNMIVVPDTAVVPVLKTQTISKVEGKEPVRTTEATVHEVTNKGKNIVAKEIYFADKDMKFSEAGMAPPVARRGSMIVPTFKIQETKRVIQQGQVVSESKYIDAAGVEFRRGQIEPVKRELQLEQMKDLQTEQNILRKVNTENGVVTSDVVILEDFKSP